MQFTKELIDESLNLLFSKKRKQATMQFTEKYIDNLFDLVLYKKREAKNRIDLSQLNMSEKDCSIFCLALEELLKKGAISE